jgi:hypothetical protein
MSHQIKLEDFDITDKQLASSRSSRPNGDDKELTFHFDHQFQFCTYEVIDHGDSIGVYFNLEDAIKSYNER